ncbi:hypothetical protein ACLOJK_039246 [Asimina triloba]
MEALISPKFLHLSFSPSLSRFYFKSLPQTAHSFPLSHKKKQSRSSKFPIFSSVTAPSTSNSPDFGGWDDLVSSQQAERSGELDQLRNFLIQVGVDDQKHIFMLLIGFVSALSITRVKLSSIAVIPVSVAVLVVGFFVGFIRGAHFNSKARNLGNLWADLDATLSELRNDMENALHSDSFEVGDMKKYCEIVEFMRLKILPVRSLAETSFTNDREAFTSNNQVWGQSSTSFVDNLKQWNDEKSNKKKRKMGDNGFSVFKFLVGGLFQENSFDSKPRKPKDGLNRGSKEMDNKSGADEMSGGGWDRRTVEKDANQQYISNMENAGVGSHREALRNLNDCQNQQQGEGGSNEDLGTSVPKAEPLQLTGLDRSGSKADVISEMLRRNVSEKLVDGEKMLNNVQSTMINGKPYKSSSQQPGYNHNMLSYDRELMSHQDNRRHISNRYGSSEEQEKVHDSGDIGMKRVPKDLDSLSLGAKASLQQERVPDGRDGSYFSSHSQEQDSCTTEKRTPVCNFKDFEEGMGRRVKSDDKPLSDNCVSNFSREVGEVPLSSTISYDEEFNLHMKEATDLLKQARECLTGQLDEEKAETVLSRSASLLSRATTMKPMSLQAVGQLGNTFLLHGELKLKISRELRLLLLSRNDSLSNERRSGCLSPLSRYQLLSRDKVASVLGDVCDECEQLLIEAGRRYRIALSIDVNDMRALYNWGLALFFRAQLIADIGPVRSSSKFSWLNS